MTKEEILKGNILIAEYIGIKLYTETKEGWRTLISLHYHESMDWLLPVIYKIREFEQFCIISDNDDKWEVSIETTGYQYVTQVYQINKSLIEGCWLACVEYIENFNNGTLKQSKK